MKAVEMFEKLDYERFIDLDNGNIIYNKIIYTDYNTYASIKKAVKFDLEKKKVYVTFSENKTCGLSIELLNAINKQMKELRWIK